MANVDYTVDAKRPRRPPININVKLSTPLGSKGVDLIIEDDYAFTASVAIVAPNTGITATVFAKKMSAGKYISTIRVTTAIPSNPTSPEPDFFLSFTFSSGTNVPANYPTTVQEGYEIP